MEQELGATLEEFKKYILEGKYRILARDENYILFEDFCITEDERKQILLDLKLEEFKKKDKSRNKKINGYVYIFNKRVQLLRRYLNEIVDVNLYIKISSYIDKNVIVISFHESL